MSNKAVITTRKSTKITLWDIILSRKRQFIGGGIAGILIVAAGYWASKWWRKKEAEVKAKEDKEHYINSLDLMKLRDANLIKHKDIQVFKANVQRSIPTLDTLDIPCRSFGPQPRLSFEEFEVLLQTNVGRPLKEPAIAREIANNLRKDEDKRVGLMEWLIFLAMISQGTSMERLAQIFGMMSNEQREEEKPKSAEEDDINPTFNDMEDNNSLTTTNNDNNNNNNIVNNTVRAGDRFISFGQLAGFLDVVLRLGWAFTEFSFVTRHMRPIATPTESPRRIAELLLKKVGVTSINENTIKIPWPIFRQLELRFIA